MTVRRCRLSKQRKIENFKRYDRRGKDVPGTIGIGHTRWATHGKPSDINSHPQVSDSGKFAVVHNGIIENYLALKDLLIKRESALYRKRIQR